MSGDLLDKVADLGATGLWLIVERMGMYEYISMITPSQGRYIYRPPPLTYVANIYYLPFQGLVWTCSIILVIICCCVIYLTYRVSPINHGTESYERHPTRPSDMILMGIGSICQMGSPFLPKMLSSKISTVWLSQFKLGFFFISFTFNLDFLSGCIALHVHFVHGQYCIFTASDNEII